MTLWCSSAIRCSQDVVLLLCCISLAFLLQGCGDGPSDGKMACGDGVPLCGVLVLQSGLGKGPYRHNEPTVHGLWPQTGQYGNSKCVKPDTNGSPQQIYTCYNQKRQRESDLMRFQKHEWDKHGRCAGVDSVSDYFKQVCTLSDRPLQVMRQSRSQGSKLQGMADALENSGYPVYELEKGTSEIHLSACAGPGGDWKLARIEDFSQTCGTRGGSAKAQCVPGEQGPKCSSDSDCAGLGGCVRCAKSGYCTEVALQFHRKTHGKRGSLLSRKEVLSTRMNLTDRASEALMQEPVDYWTQFALVNQA